MPVGLVGLDDQSEPTAHRILQAGHGLHIYARRPAQTRTLVARGAIEEPSLAALAECSELIGICVDTDAQTLDVAEQLLAASPPRSVLAIRSTVHPQLCQEIGPLGAQRAISVVDAPFSGPLHVHRDSCNRATLLDKVARAGLQVAKSTRENLSPAGTA